MSEQMVSLGGRLRELRKGKKMTLQQLAVRTGVSAGLLSKIENLRALPSLAVLFAIAAALETEMASLFTASVPDAACRRWRHVRAADFKRIDREKNSGFTYELILESRLTGDRQQVMLVTVAPEAKREPVSGDGTEILYLISGRLNYRIGDDVIDFRCGDVLFFDSSVPHGPSNDSGEPAVLLAHYLLNEPIF